jgi:hypothetical protein
MNHFKKNPSYQIEEIVKSERSEIDEIEDQMIRLDRLKPLLVYPINKLASQQKALLSIMALNPIPLTIKEIETLSRGKINIHVIVKRLIEEGYLEKIDKKFYQINSKDKDLLSSIFLSSEPLLKKEIPKENSNNPIDYKISQRREELKASGKYTYKF